MKTKLRKLTLQEAHVLVSRCSRAHIAVASCNGVHEVSLSRSVTEVHAHVESSVFCQLRDIEGMRVATLMFPGMGPYQALISVSDVVALDYEVKVQYVNRPNDPVDF